METLSFVLSALAVLIVIYYYLLKNYNTFVKHGIRHIPPTPIIGNMGPLITKKVTIIDLMQRFYDIHPEAKYVGLYEFTSPVLLIRDVDLIKSIAVKNFDSFQDHRGFADKKVDRLLGNMLFTLRGEEWKDKRAMVSPTFTSSKIKSMFALISHCAFDFADYASKLPEGERELELKSLMTKYANDVITSCAFGVPVDSKRDPNNIFYVYGKASTNFATFWIGLKMLMYRNVPWLGRALNIRMTEKKISDFFENLVASTVRTREEEGISRPDMIQLLIDVKNKKQLGREFTVDDISTQAFTFFFGGFDTVASQSCYIVHHIAVNPEVRERLQREIDQVLEDTQGQVTYDAIMGMKYLDAVINEGMRMNPIVAFLDRQCVKRFELPPALPGEKPFTVEPGMNVWFPVMAIHRDPKNYENPDKFDPERFFNDSKGILNSGMFLPFGIGPRICIGFRFALCEIKLMVFHMFARCNVTRCSRTSEPLVLQKGILGLAPKDGFWLKIEPREDPHPLLKLNS